MTERHGRRAVRSPTTGLLAVVALAMLLSVAASAQSAEIEGVQFPDSYEVEGAAFDLSCVGVLRYMVFIKGYVAALYLGKGATPGNVLGDVPKRLVIHYLHAIKAEQFAEATDKGVGGNVDAATFDRLRPHIDQLNRLYEDVAVGDQYSLTYVPGRGTELALNGHAKGTIAGAEFAAAIFAVWLGPQPLDISLRDQLLGCS